MWYCWKCDKKIYNNLPDYDVYLDPKNSYVVKQNAEKLSAVLSEHKIVLFYGECKDIIEKLEKYMS